MDWYSYNSAWYFDIELREYTEEENKDRYKNVGQVDLSEEEYF